MTGILTYKEIRRARKAFINTHEGIEPRYTIESVAGDPRKGLTELGKLSAVEYLTDKGDGPAIYRHDFGPGALLTFNKDKFLIIVGNSYTIGRGGIEG